MPVGRVLAVVTAVVVAVGSAGCRPLSEETVRPDVAVPDQPPMPVPEPLPPDIEPGLPVDDAPAFLLTSDVGEIVVEPFASCWMSGNVNACGEGEPVHRRHLLATSGGFQVGYPEGDVQLRVLGAGEGGAALSPAVTARGEQVWDVDTSELLPGDYEAEVFWQGPQGDAAAAFTLRVLDR